MYNLDLSTQDVKNVKNLLLPASTEEKVLKYLSLQSSNPKSKKTNNPLLTLVSYVLVTTQICFGLFLIGKSIYGNNVFNNWISPVLQNTLHNVFSFVFWGTVLLLGLVIIFFIALSAESKIEFICSKSISRVVRKNYFSKIFGWICTASLITGFILSGYWFSLVFYFGALFAGYILKIGLKEELKKAIETLDQTRMPIEMYFQQNALTKKIFW